MELRHYDDAAAFLDRARTFLLPDEAVHNLLFGIAANLRSRPDYYGSAPPYLATVEDAGTVVAAAIRTPPRHLLLSLTDRPAALDAIAADMHEHRVHLPGVIAPAPLGQRFAATWSRLTGQPIGRVLAERIYRLDRVIPPAPVPGALRRATTADRPLLLEWVGAFRAEVGEGEGADAGEIARGVDARLAGEHGAFYLWEDGAPVSLVACGGPTPHGIRIGPVYTPPARRGGGYARACVAAVSQAMLDDGRRFCFLFADLGNPTVNRLYPAIGYLPAGDAEEVAFDYVPATNGAGVAAIVAG